MRAHQHHHDFITLLLGQGRSGDGDSVLQRGFFAPLVQALAHFQKKLNRFTSAVPQHFDTRHDKGFGEYR
jgi:hypothetical protein